MKFHPSNLFQVTLVSFVLFLSFSCNKDSDLLAEYVVEKSQSLLVNDVVVTLANNPIVIAPLSNDTFEKPENVAITEVTPPKMGTAVVNEDNTITYTPDTDRTGTDEFDYSTAVTNPDNTVTKETGSVTVTVTDKTPTTEGPVEMGGLKAFPGAEGFGKNATGGRGGKVLFVTNLNDSGSGSFRAAVEAKGPRTVVFRVGGTINLTSNLTIDNDDITIAGETAPGDGILLKGDIFQVKANNVIIRYLRSRYGGSGQGTGDAMSVYASTRSISDIIFDHCSISWGGDENFNVRGNGNNIATDITLQNSIIAECGYGLLLYQGSNRVSIHRNLFAFNSDRNIRANYASGNNDLRYEMVNNLVYGFKNSPNNATLGIKYSLVNNKYKSSSSFSNNAKDVAISSNVDSGVSASWSYAFIEGNIHGGLGEYSSAVNPFLKSTPFDTSGLVESALNANELEGALLGHIGAGLSRDAVDNRIIDSYISGTGQLSGLGSYPTIKDGTPYTDADNDGIEDSFEIANWGSLATNNTTDSDGDGYTNLEVFLHSLTI